MEYARTAKLHLALRGVGKRAEDKLAEAFEAVLAAVSGDGGGDDAASACWRRMLPRVPTSPLVKPAI